MSSFRYRWGAAAAGVILVGACLTGCTPTPPALQAKAAEQLRAGVLEVTTAAAAGDYAGAQAALGSVQTDLLEAASAEQVTSARSAEIQAAINLVGADLAAAIAAVTPSPAPSPGDGDSDEEGDGSGNNGNGNNGNGNSGNGNGGNNGKGNGGGSTPAPTPPPTTEPSPEPTEPPATEDPGAEPTPETGG